MCVVSVNAFVKKLVFPVIKQDLCNNYLEQAEQNNW